MNPTQKQAIDNYNEFLKKSNLNKLNCICGSSRNFQLFKKDRHGIINSVVLCMDCGIVRSNQVPSKEEMNI